MSWRFWPRSSRDDPGAHEAHLQRRHENIPFVPERRVFTTQDILEARLADQLEQKVFVLRLQHAERVLSGVNESCDGFGAITRFVRVLPLYFEELAGLDKAGDRFRPRLSRICELALKKFEELSDDSVRSATGLVTLRATLVECKAFSSCAYAQITGRSGYRQFIPPDEVMPALFSLPLGEFAEMLRVLRSTNEHAEASKKLFEGALEVTASALSRHESISELGKRVALLTPPM